MMKPCFLKIVTVVDGEESIFSQEAEMELFSESAKLRYFENGGKVSLHISNGQVTVAREGDYILRLLLKEGKKNRGIIGVSGSEGEVETVGLFFDTFSGFGVDSVQSTQCSGYSGDGYSGRLGHVCDGGAGHVRFSLSRVLRFIFASFVTLPYHDTPIL